MAYDVTCPGCGGPSTIHSPFAKMAVCANCSNTLWLTQDGVKAGPKMTAPTPALSGLFIGAEGQLRQKPFTVVGRVRYKHGRGFWDEWFLTRPDDTKVWLSEDEGELSVEKEYSFKGELLDFKQVRPGQRMTLSGHPFLVDETGVAVCESGEGELPFQIEPGEEVPYLEGTIDKRMATLEYDEDGPKLFLGEYLAMGALKVDAETAARMDASRKAAPRKVHKSVCPNCGGNLVLRLGDDAEMIVCEYCDSQIDVSAEKFKVLGKMLRAGPKEELIRIGAKGKLRGVEWEVVGRLRYRDVTP